MTTLIDSRAETYEDPTPERLSLARAHPAPFIDAFCMINDPNNPNAGIFRFRLWAWQWQFLDLVLVNNRVVVLKARQLGVSWLLAAYALWVFLMRPGSVILFISKRENEAKSLMAKAVFIYHRLPPELKFSPHRKDKDSDTEFSSFSLRSRMQALAATKDVGRSETATLVIPDEWAFQEYAAEMYGGYEPTLGMNGQLLGCSTANGPGGFFYAVYQAAKKRANGFLPVFLPWDLRPGRTPEWREQKRQEYAEQGRPELLASEYPENDVEAFSGSINLFFPVDLQLSLISSLRNPLRVIPMDLDDSSGPVCRGELRVYQDPAFSRRYVVGADVALGITGGNWSTAAVLDTATGRVAATLRLHIAPDLFAVKLAELGARYNNALLAPELNNHGLATVTALEKMIRYPNLYRDPVPIRTSSHAASTFVRPAGWRTNVKTKPKMLFDLRTALADGSLVTEDGWFADEIQFFSQNGEPPEPVAYEAAPGHTDDMVMAYAIANAVRHSSFGVSRGIRHTGRLSR